MVMMDYFSVDLKQENAYCVLLIWGVKREKKWLIRSLHC